MLSKFQPTVIVPNLISFHALMFDETFRPDLIIEALRNIIKRQSIRVSMCVVVPKPHKQEEHENVL